MNDPRAPSSPSSTESPVGVDLCLGSELLECILQHHGVAGWNLWLQALRGQDGKPLTPDCFAPLSVTLTFHQRDLSGRTLNGIDLGDVEFAGANFAGTSLQGSRFCFARLEDCSFREADLTAANFQNCNISGADFTGANLEGVLFDGALFDPARPPHGLPSHLVSALYEESAAIYGEQGTPEWNGWKLVSITEHPSVELPAQVAVVSWKNRTQGAKKEPNA